MPTISYAQNGEDILLNRLFPAEHRGFYVDIGANHPTLHSVTRLFYDRGWRGLNVEPVVRVHKLLCAERPEDVNLAMGISDRDGVRTLHEPEGSLGMSTFDPDFAAGLLEHGYDYIQTAVPVTTLANLFELYVGGREIDFLKIDVEGHEAAVVRSGDWKRWRPRALVVEATIQPDVWEPILLDADYHRAAFDGLNRYYVREEDAEAWLPKLEAPVNILDDFERYEHRCALETLARELDETRLRLSAYEEIGATALSVARRVRGLAQRWPRAASLARRVGRRAS